MLTYARSFLAKIYSQAGCGMGVNKKQQKIIDTLNRRVELCREFMNDWLLFNQIMTSYSNPGANKAQLENQFLRIKSKIARSHQVLKENLLDDYKIDGATMNIVSGATSLEAIYSQSEVAIKKLQTEWHRAFISINETLGTIEDKKRRAEMGEKVFLMPGVGQGPPVRGGGGFDFGQNKTLVIILVVAAVIGGFIFINPGGMADPWIKSFQDLTGGGAAR